MESALPESVPFHVLLAEDDRELRELLSSVLRREGFAVTALEDGAKLLDYCADHLGSDGRIRGVDLLVSDVRMPGFSGLDVLTALRRVSVRCPVVLVTAFGDEALHQFARQLGVVAVLDKPFDVNELTYFASVQRTLSGGAPES
ncbi:MAG: response regulator [Myxococcales bacterium]|nr:response regulator [Myxococcales bacterium]